MFTGSITAHDPEPSPPEIANIVADSNEAITAERFALFAR
jgi:hypothetical protein